MNRFFGLNIKEPKLPFPPFNTETVTFSPTEKSRMIIAGLEFAASLVKAGAESNKAYMDFATEELKRKTALEIEHIKMLQANEDRIMDCCRQILDDPRSTPDQRDEAYKKLLEFVRRG